MTVSVARHGSRELPFLVHVRVVRDGHAALLRSDLLHDRLACSCYRGCRAMQIRQSSSEYGVERIREWPADFLPGAYVPSNGFYRGGPAAAPRVVAARSAAPC